MVESMPPVKPARSSSSAPATVWKCSRATSWAKASERPRPLPPINFMSERSIIFGPLAIERIYRRQGGDLTEEASFFQDRRPVDHHRQRRIRLHIHHRVDQKPLPVGRYGIGRKGNQKSPGAELEERDRFAHL